MRFILVNDEMIDTTMHPEIEVDREIGHVYEKRQLPNGSEYLFDKGVIVEESNDVIKLVNMLVNIRLQKIMKEIKEIKSEMNGVKYYG